MQLENQDNQARLTALLASQKKASVEAGMPSAEQRVEWIDKSIDLLLTHHGALEDAMCSDFGWRSKDQSMMTDISSSVGALRHARKNLAKWMRPQKRGVEFPLGIFGARANVRFQPKGVVGLISPWNFPVNLTFAPLAGIFAAGNRAMIKPSEFTGQTSALMADLFSQYYSEEEVAVVTGGAEVGAAFSSLPFDHLIFTGATSIAHHIMRAAAENLVPLTLELGGKSPVLIGRSADLQKAALRIMNVKTLNCGQICLAPDYALMPDGQVEDFVEHAKTAVADMFPSGMRDNDDYTSVVNLRHFERLQGYLQDAKEKGGEVIEINPTSEDFSRQDHHRMPPYLVLNASDDMKVMQEEIFGPIFPVKTYQDIGQAIDFVNARPRPLGLYYFGEDKAEQERVLNFTISGGVTLNDVFHHVGQENLPFGGVGASGMGAYHGHDGFLEFSHSRAVYTQVKGDLLAVIRPPYGDKFRQLFSKRLK